MTIPLAVLLGVMLATPLDSTTLLLVGSAFLLLLTPILLRHHHVLLIASWSAYLNAFFLPGQPYLWLLMAAVSLFVSILTRTLNRDRMRFYWIPSVTIPLLLFALVVFVTAQLRGGIGARSLGSEVFGGKRYFYVWGAIAGFLALACRGIEPEKRGRYAGFFFLSGITAVFGNIAYSLGPKFYFLFLLFPPEWVMQQVVAEELVAGSITRIGGLAPASTAAACFLLLRYGISGIFDFTRPWRFALFAGVAAAGLFSGFRSQVVFLLILFFFQFFAEGLYRTKFLPLFLVGATAAAAVILPFTDRLPLPIQRALTFLPVKVDPLAKRDANSSLEWRLDMWRVVLIDVPRYFWIGKGYAINPTDLYLAEESTRRGVLSSFDPAIISGDYHSGPFSVLLPFGIFGVLTFTAFIVMGTRVMWLNFRYGEQSIKNLNTFFLAYWCARVLFFITIFGAVHVDMALFTGAVGLSLSLNHGLRTREALAFEPVTEQPSEEAVVVSPGSVRPRPLPAPMPV